MNYVNEIEKELAESAALSVREAKSITIADNEQYRSASELLVEHKGRITQIKEYWERPKKAAKAAHQEICDKEKEMLAPFTQAETIIKGLMVAYQQKVDRERRAAEEEARRKQQEEAARLMELAAKAEAAGKTSEAETVLDAAMAAEEAPIINMVVAPKAEGIGVRKTWKARVINEKLVPAYSNDVEVRTINMSALNTLARISNGTASVPGVEFYEDMTISART